MKHQLLEIIETVTAYLDDAATVGTSEDFERLADALEPLARATADAKTAANCRHLGNVAWGMRREARVAKHLADARDAAEWLSEDEGGGVQ
jgi:hypothetical protein